MKDKNHYQFTGESWEGWSDAEVWEIINDALNDKKRKRLLPWFFFVGMGIIATCVVLYMNYFKSSETIKVSKSEQTLLANSEYAKLKNMVNSQCITGQDSIFQRAKYEINNRIINKPTKSKLTDTNLPNIDLGSSENIMHIISLPYMLENSNAYTEEGTHDINREMVPLGKQSIKPISSLIGQKLEKTLLINIPPKIDQKPTFYLFFEIGVGKGYLKNNYSDNIPWQQLSNNHITDLFSTFHTLSLTKSFKNNLLLHVGLSYIRNRSQLVGSHQTTSIETFESDSARIQTIDNVNYYYAGQLTKTVIKNENFNVYNTRSSLSIPLQIGYLLYGQKHSLLMLAGIQYTFAQNISGYMFDTDETIVTFNNLKQLKIEKYSGFNDVMGEIKYLQQINTALDFSLGLGIKYSISPVVSIHDKDGNYQYINNNSFYVQAGLGYKW